MKLSLLFLFLFTALFQIPQSTAQEIDTDSGFYVSAIQNAFDFYQRTAGDQRRLINGREYKAYRMPFVNGHPFFSTGKFAEGSIIYEDCFYDHVQLLYDEAQELVILEAGVTIELITDRIKEFSISGHHFVRLENDSLAFRPGDGFYERLYNGQIEVYKKEKKAIEEDLSSTEGVQGEIRTKRFYFIKKGGRYYPVIKKKDIYDILRNRKAEIQRFVKTNGLDLRKGKDDALPRIAAFYDQLTK